MRNDAYFLIVVVFILWCGCTTPRQEVPSSTADQRALHFPTITYQEMRGEVARRCISCHGPAKQEGKYDLSTYFGLLGVGSDATPNAIAGNKDSLILTVLRADSPVKEHQVEQAWKDRLTQWVVEFRLAYFRSNIHTSNIHLPSEPGFHGALLNTPQKNWSECTQCHGSDLKGAGTGASCLSCHQSQTTEGCGSCHQIAPSATQAFQGVSSRRQANLGDVHQAHFQNRWMTALTCTSCHTVPVDWRDPGHLDGKVQIVFGKEASQGDKKPRWNEIQKSCADTYCHNSGIAGAIATIPTWQKPINDLNCQSCHGNPPGKLRNGNDHPNDTRCSLCHQNVDQNNNIIRPELHINGRVEFTYPSQCNTCHGDDKSAAPPKDLSGNTATTARGVGAHQAHLQNNGRNVAVACEACHQVPASTEAPGHLDATLPAEVLFQSLAVLGGLQPKWDRDTNTCSQVYCHGASLDGGTHTSPVWTKVDGGQTTCGSCHGNPPLRVRSGASHTASKDCYLCHSSMNKDGTIKKPELHINGRVDL